jgi:vancomycin permeability regulator SanA
MKKYIGIIYLTIAIFADYFGLVFLKYYLNDFSIFEFNITSFGNLIFTICFISTVIFIILLSIKRFTLLNKNIKQLYFVVLLLVTSYLVLLYVINSNVFEGSKYLWGYPLRRILTAILFSANFWLLLYVLSVLFLMNFNSGVYIYLKSLAYSSIIIILILILSFIYTLTFTDAGNIEEKNDLAVILGAAVWKGNVPSPILYGRIVKAAELYKDKKIKKILVTGGNAPGELTEAEVSYRNLIKLGVKREDIKIEMNTATTVDQVKYLKKYEYLQGNEKIIIISDQFHLKRVLEICKFFNIKASGIASNTKYVFKKLLFYRVRESVALLLFWLFAI